LVDVDGIGAVVFLLQVLIKPAELFHLITANAALSIFKSAIWMLVAYSSSASSLNDTNFFKWFRLPGVLVVVRKMPSKLLSPNCSSQHWSAVTIHDPQGRPFIIHNPDHAPTRQESDLMHEAAHIICKHPPGKIVKVGELNFRSYDEQHEDEAKWLGGCFQITRRALLWAISRRMTPAQMSEHFCASEAIVRYRRNVTGADVQMTRFQKTTRH
jgi:Zn-dependent peptidase ImmA (M78 family)